jgi:hypothetical protein
MVLQEKRPWTAVALFSVILILTALVLEYFGPALDPWSLPKASGYTLETSQFPSLTGINFECAAKTGLLAKIDLNKREGICSGLLTEDVTRCASDVPFLGFGDRIRCAKPEQAHCEEAGIQAIGLFKGDVFCTKSGDVDLGPPPPRARENEP